MTQAPETIKDRSPWWVGPLLALLLFGLIGGGVAAYAFDNPAYLIISVISFCILYAG